MLDKLAEDKFLDDIFNTEFDAVLKGRDTDEESLYEDGIPPVSVEEFINGEDYLNLGKNIYPRIKQCLREVEKPNIRESYMLLGKGSGKTTALEIYMSYGVYKALCLQNPQKYFGLIPGDSLVALLVSVSEKQAKEVGFAGILNMISRSNWFKGKYTPFSKEIQFDKNITLYSGHSGASSWLGFNTFRAAMDEMEWMRDSSNKSVSRELYRALKGSLNSRFPEKYKLLCISSVKNDFSPLNSRFNSVKEKGRKIDLGPLKE